MKKLVFVLSLLSLCACSHTINFRANHFAVPVVGEQTWHGHGTVGFAVPTKITLINDKTSNPPSRTTLGVNEDVDFLDLFLINELTLDLALALTPGLEAYLEDTLIGLRWQFLNNGNTSNVWVASLQGGLGSRSKSSTDGSSSNPSTAKSNITVTQAGLSIGYKLASVIPYVSAIRETYDVSTTVDNPSGKFGPYSDKGIHDFLSVGFANHNKGLRAGIEYSMVNINWDRLTKPAYQNAIGLNLGYTW